MIKADKAFRAVSDKTRLRLLALLRGSEVCVCDLMSALRLSQPKISRHLAYLKDAGLVEGRKQGRWRYYSRAAAEGRVHARILACVEAAAAEDAAVRADRRRLRPSRCA